MNHYLRLCSSPALRQISRRSLARCALRAKNTTQNVRVPCSPVTPSRTLQPTYAAVRSLSTMSAQQDTEQVVVVDPLLKLTLAEAAEQLAQGKVTSVALTKACLAQIEQTNGKTNAYVSILSETALSQAEQSDVRRTSGTPLGPLDGIPIAIKDNFCVEGTLTSAASDVLSTFISPYNATVVQRLLDAGAVILGKTNMDEFGMGSYGHNSHFGAVKNPLTISSGDHTAGGSSSGSAAALASYTCFAALGSDTGGSVRLPASYTGTVGLKPTYGLLSRYGLIAYGSSLDCPGVMTRTTTDTKMVLEVVAGADEKDSTCIFTHTPHHKMLLSGKTESDNSKPLSGMRVGIPRELMFSELPDSVKEAWNKAASLLQSQGADVVTVSIPALEHAIAVYYTLAPAEAVSNLSRYDGVRYGQNTYAAQLNKTFGKAEEAAGKETAADASTDADAAGAVVVEGESDATLGAKKKAGPQISALQQVYTRNRTTFFGAEVQRRITIGNFVLSSQRYNSYVGKAMEIRSLLTEQLTFVLNVQENGPDAVDILLFPTATSVAPSFASLEKAAVENPVGGYIDDVMTVFANLAGLPAISVPIAEVEQDGVKLPLGIQLMGPALSEYTLLNIGEILEQNK